MVICSKIICSDSLLFVIIFFIAINFYLYQTIVYISYNKNK